MHILRPTGALSGLGLLQWFGSVYFPFKYKTRSWKFVILRLHLLFWNNTEKQKKNHSILNIFYQQKAKNLKVLEVHSFVSQRACNHCNKRCLYTSSAFTGFWVNSFVSLNTRFNFSKFTTSYFKACNHCNKRCPFERIHSSHWTSLVRKQWIY
jgi:hypothetical protein